MTISYFFLSALLLATLATGLVIGLVVGMDGSDTRDDE